MMHSKRNRFGCRSN